VLARERRADQHGAQTRVDRDVDSHLQIGGASIYGQYFPGTIDEIRIYNRALSATEIQSEMNTPLP
jgi:hypothetical protein